MGTVLRPYEQFGFLLILNIKPKDSQLKDNMIQNPV